MFEMLIISVPVFYIIGLVSTIVWLSKVARGPAEKRQDFLKTFITELRRKNSINPNQKVSELLNEYEKEQISAAFNSSPEPAITTGYKTPVPSVIYPKPKENLQGDIETFWTNWYSNNSINFLLYIGAFLIVASASIFVGIQWESIGGIAKASLLTGLTASFIGLGIWFYKLPKIQNAGVTFSAIGSMLIPFTGIAWYNFVFVDLVNFGVIWCLTSVIGLLTYIGIGTLQKSKFYTYSASIATLSIAMSFVNMYHLDNTFYILSGIASSYILLITRLLLKHEDEKASQLVIIPLDIASTAILALSLGFGFIAAIADNKLFTLETTLSAGLTALYFFTAFFTLKKSWQLAAGEIMVPLTLALFCKWQNIDDRYMLYTQNLIVTVMLILGSFLQTKNQPENAHITLGIAQATSIMTFLGAVILAPQPVHLSLFSIMPAIVAISAYDITLKPVYVAIVTLFITIFTHYFFGDLLELRKNYPYLLGLIYLLESIGCYIYALHKKSSKNLLSIAAVSTILMAALSVMWTAPRPEYTLLVSVVLAGIAFHASFAFKEKSLLYCSNALLYFAVFNILRYLDTDIVYYPLAFSGISAALYVLSHITPENIKEPYRKTGIAGIVAVPILFGLMGMSEERRLETYALITAYAALTLTALDAALQKNESQGYFASAIGMVTYLWQIKYLEFTDIQMYTLPLGVYFMVLAYTRRLKNDTEKRNILDTIGLVVLGVPTFLQSYGTDGAQFALLLGIEGAILLSLGISLKYRTYTYSGIGWIVLAVFSQTYSYLLLIPRWLITGVIGIGFLVLAIFLLLKRNDSHNK